MLAIIDKGKVLACDTPANLKRQVQRYPLYELSLAPGANGWVVFLLLAPLGAAQLILSGWLLWKPGFGRAMPAAR